MKYLFFIGSLILTFLISWNPNFSCFGSNLQNDNYLSFISNNKTHLSGEVPFDCEKDTVNAIKPENKIITVKEEVEPEELVISEIEIISNMQKVADWQMDNFTYNAAGSHDYGIAAWTHATLYLGLAKWAEIAPNATRCYDWLYDKGNKGNWDLGKNYTYHADELCVGQFYIAMYDKYKEEEMIKSITERVDYIMANPPSNQSMSHGNKQLWTWCDALFMAPPVYTQLANLYPEKNYLSYMDKQYRKLYNHLYDKEEKLFYRDDSYFNKKEANGEKVFWGRGNGWALAGITNILKSLPSGSEYKKYYEEIFRELALKLIELQNDDGAWHASLLDPDSYPAPETSATALITYALAYGLNNNLLTEDEAYKPMTKAWIKLCDAIHTNGKLGFVQPVGQDPKTVTKDMTATFGVGAFLLAGTEIYKYLN